MPGISLVHSLQQPQDAPYGAAFPSRFSLQRHLLQYKEPLERCLAEAKLAEGLPADAANEFLLPKSARRHIFPR